MAETVYMLCALASLACMILLVRGYRRSRERLLLWAGLCFASLTANNVLLFLHKVVLTSGPDLFVLRTSTALLGLMVLIYGLVWDSE